MERKRMIKGDEESQWEISKEEFFEPRWERSERMWSM